MFSRFIMVLSDALIISFSAIAAFFIHRDFNLTLHNIASIGTYTLVCLASSIPISIVFGLDRIIWRLSSLKDYLNVVKTVVSTIIVASAGDFLIERMQGVPRALPLLQAVLSIAVLIGVRVVFRSFHRSNRIRKKSLVVESRNPLDERDNILLVGVNREAELYSQFAREFLTNHIEIIGAVSDTNRHVGLSFSGLKVLGTVNDIPDVLRTLEVHGISVDHIVITVQRHNLTKDISKILTEIEDVGEIRVAYLYELMFPVLPKVPSRGPSTTSEHLIPAFAASVDAIRHRRYWKVKRFLDIVTALLLIVLSAPLFALVALLVAIDVGMPLTFWQRRPGRFGRPFHLMKFRTMKGAHDTDGNRLADDERTSRIGAFIRKTRLDELPQLLHILVGEMSFVGPRPLLPIDLPRDPTMRLMVRPGLTGWAQVQGGRVVSPEDKAILDEWYVHNASFLLDMKTLLLTVPMVLLGENYNIEAIEQAKADLQTRT